MKPVMPVVGIPADVKTIDGYIFHAVGEKYIDAVAHGSGALPVPIPALGPGQELHSLLERVDLHELVARLDGLFLTGSPSNVEPWRYDGEASTAGTAHDPQRDSTTLPLIRAALAEGLPLLAVCRGLQELNVALGGTLHQHVEQVAGLQDHREDKHLPREQRYEPAHSVVFSADGLLSELAGSDEAMVNSLHAQGIARLADELIVEATAPDGLIEAARVRNAHAFALGVQWHPEWAFREDPLSRALFAAFGEAVRQRKARR